jgi:hypothetical protein
MRSVVFRRMGPASILYALTMMIWHIPALMPAQSGEGYSMAEAEKVLKTIERIQLESDKRSSSSERSVVLTESEINSYIAYRIESEKEEVMRVLQLRIFDQNRLEGKAVIDLSGKKIPPFLKSRMTLLFSADLFIEGAKARLEFRDLFLEEQKIQPFILDAVISLAARFSGGEPVNLREGVELPYGIKDIKTGKGLAAFYY